MSVTAVRRVFGRFGRYGMPLDMVYGPGPRAGIALLELLMAGAVMALPVRRDTPRPR